METLEPHTEKEISFKRSHKTLEYIKRFSSTEKAIFIILILMALFTSLSLAKNAAESFMIEMPTEGGTLREGVIGLPRTVNPVLAVTDADKDLTSLVYSGLMKYSDGDIIPDLASSYKISEDGLTYTFNLKEDLRFQDGEPLTAEDIAFTIQKIQDPALKSPRRSDWLNVTVKIVSPRQIEFVLKQPYSPFIANTTFGVLPKHIWGTVGDEQFIFSQYNIEPVGSGPYRVNNISRDSGGIPTEYSLSTWRGYHGDKPFITNIQFIYFSDEAKALTALDGGNIDSLSTIAPYDASILAKDKAQSYEILSSPLPRIFGVYFNQNQNPALADLAVRRALELSVDRQEIIDKTQNGYAVAIDSALPFGLSSSSSTVPAQDMQKAIDILEKAGWKKNANGIYEKTVKTSKTLLSIELFTADSKDLKETAELLKTYWSALGVDVNVKVFEASDLYQNIIRTRKYDALLFGEFIGKDKDLYAFWHSSQRNYPGLNIAMYTNSNVDKILNDLRNLEDEKEKTKKYAALDTEISKDVPALFLYAPEFIYAVPKALHAVDLKDMTVPSDRWNTIDKWYIHTEKVWTFLNR